MGVGSALWADTAAAGGLMRGFAHRLDGRREMHKRSGLLRGWFCVFRLPSPVKRKAIADWAGKRRRTGNFVVIKHAGSDGFVGATFLSRFIVWEWAMPTNRADRPVLILVFIGPLLAGIATKMSLLPAD